MEEDERGRRGRSWWAFKVRAQSAFATLQLAAGSQQPMPPANSAVQTQKSVLVFLLFASQNSDERFCELASSEKACVTRSFSVAFMMVIHKDGYNESGPNVL